VEEFLPKSIPVMPSLTEVTEIEGLSPAVLASGCCSTTGFVYYLYNTLEILDLRLKPRY
jgi:hypothetical protein